jgi:hypothetical protein
MKRGQELVFFQAVINQPRGKKFFRDVCFPACMQAIVQEQLGIWVRAVKPGRDPLIMLSSKLKFPSF